MIIWTKIFFIVSEYLRKLSKKEKLSRYDHVYATIFFRCASAIGANGHLQHLKRVCCSDGTCMPRYHYSASNMIAFSCRVVNGWLHINPLYFH